MLQLIVQKATRWRENHPAPLDRASSVVSNPTWPPPAQSAAQASLDSTSMSLQCFASDQRGSLNHLDTKNLQTFGVWLGDYANERELI